MTLRAQQKEKDAALIAAYIAAHGVKRSVDFGLEHPAVDALKELGIEVFRLKKKGITPRPWMVNGGERTTNELWDVANRERAKRGLPPLKKPVYRKRG